MKWLRRKFKRGLTVLIFFFLARAERRTFAEQLHRSNAWHCGCRSCRPRTVLGVRIDKLKLTEEEAARLRINR